MKPFDYTRAHAPACAVRTVAADPGARYLAGGTNLVDHLKLGLAEPEHVVDVRSALDETVDPGYAVHSFGPNSQRRGSTTTLVRCGCENFR